MRSQRADQIKILELVCSYILPRDFTRQPQEITIHEEDFKRDGFEFNEATNLIKDLFHVISKLHFVNEPDGRRGLRIVVDEDIQNLLTNLKYPNHEIEEYAWDDMVNSQSTVSKTPIVINDKKGIYRADNDELVYKIKIPSKRFDLILFIAQKDKVSITDISEKFNQTSTLAIKEIKTINATFQSKLKVFNDLIIHLNTGGYCLNRDKFNIQP